MTQFFTDLAEQVPDATPGALSDAIGNYQPAPMQLQAQQLGARSVANREGMRAARQRIAQRTASKAAP